MKKQTLLALFLGFWALIFAVFIGVKEYTLRTGTEILLATRPVDPRDLFRGDYVIFSYEIGRIENPTMQTFKAGDTIYVQLEEIEGIHSAKVISSVEPEDTLFIKGKVTRATTDTLFIEYGIESYFVPEGRGREIERIRNQLLVKTRLDKFGNALVTGFIHEGEEIEI